MLATIIMSVLLAVTSPVVSRPAVQAAETQIHHEYCVVTEISPFDDETDLVIVRKADGNEYEFYADACSFMSPQCLNVTFNAKGEIIDAVAAW